MVDTAVRPPAASIRPLDVFLSAVVLFALAVALPLLDLLGRNAEFFLARAAPPIDIILLGLLVAIVVPVTLGLIIVAVYKVHAPTGRIVHAAVITILGGLFVLEFLGWTPLGDLPGWIEIAVGLGAGALIAVAFYRFEALRSVTRFGSVVPLIVVCLFLFASSASQLVFTAPALARSAVIAVGDPAPVVLVLFDEFPVASLMDGEGNIQENLYPNFARLARDGTWFRNAITVQQQTEDSLPAILTGVDPSPGKLPSASQYPATLFTLLADGYDIHAVESTTDLCPEYACENTTRPALAAGQRWGGLFADLRIVAGHLFLPNDLAAGLPSIDQSWSNFGGGDGVDATDLEIIARFNEKVDADRRVPIAQFIRDIEPASGEPQLHFLHALLPHIPWTYLPSGQGYPNQSPLPGSIPRGWGDDEWLVDQAYQQHLLQVQYVDTIVGELIARLEETGLYDDALIVILADHGVTIRPGVAHRRLATPETIGDVAAIPLFIKLPHDTGSGPDDYRAETVDVLPTIADVLDIDVPWATDGRSLFSPDRPVRTESHITGAEGTVVFGTSGDEARAIAALKVEHFGETGPFGLAPPEQSDLLGIPIDQLDVQPIGETTATIRDPGSFNVVDVDGPVLPAAIIGSVQTSEEGDLVIAVGINGSIVAVTRSYRDADGSTRFYALIPPESFVDGRNEVDLILVRGTGTGRTFDRMR